MLHGHCWSDPAILAFAGRMISIAPAPVNRNQHCNRKHATNDVGFCRCGSAPGASNPFQSQSFKQSSIKSITCSGASGGTQQNSRRPSDAYGEYPGPTQDCQSFYVYAVLQAISLAWQRTPETTRMAGAQSMAVALTLTTGILDSSGRQLSLPCHAQSAHPGHPSIPPPRPSLARWISGPGRGSGRLATSSCPFPAGQEARLHVRFLAMARLPALVLQLATVAPGSCTTSARLYRLLCLDEITQILC